jgi:AraC-like DNA-binding protein
MPLSSHLLRSGDSLDLAQQPPAQFHLLLASGRGIQADVPPGWLSVWWPLRGELSLSSGGSEWRVASRQAQVWREGALRCRSLGPHAWLAITGSTSLWEARWNGRDRQASALLPWRGRIRHDCAGLLIRLARSTPASSTHHNDDTATLLEAFTVSLLEQQVALQALVSRCNGRTHERRRQTLMRLLRVRHLIECNPDTRLDLDRLSRMANYSPCHLIRVYRAVFDETPSEYAARLREQQAWRMVSDTGLPICEITEMLGFESQSAFCRAFKNAFGQTTSEVRRAPRQTEKGRDRHERVAA